MPQMYPETPRFASSAEQQVWNLLRDQLLDEDVMIFGQREALDNTVIVRNMETRSQDTVKIDDLKDYIKKLK